MKTLCDAFDVHRSSFKYWVSRDKSICSEEVEARAVVKEIHEESNGSAGARTISQIATDRGIIMGIRRQLTWPVDDKHLGRLF